jgi:hypothetical protein
LCDHALIGAYSMGAREVTPSIVKKASKEALPTIRIDPPESRSKLLPALLLVLMMAITAVLFQPELREPFYQYWHQLPALTELLHTKSAASAPEKTAIVAAKPATETVSPLPVPPQAEPTTQPSASSYSKLTPEKMDAMRKEADVDFRLGIPAGGNE